MMPTVGSLFSGIGGFDLGLELAGWQVIWQMETNPFRRRILKHHFPNVELRGDIATDTDGLEAPDLICGGFPCQDVSVAGNRAGLDGKRSGLWYEYLRVVRELRPTWVLIENVPGLLSSNEGKDFEIVVSGLAECGYGVAWRVLDSQNWGVPQRRRRVFIVGHLGAPCPPEILFESEGGGGDSAAGEEAKKEVAGTLGGGSGGRGWANDLDNSGAFIPERAYPLSTKQRDGDCQDTYVVNARQDPIVGKQPLDRSGHSLAVAIRTAQTGSNGWGVAEDVQAHTLENAQGQAVAVPIARNVAQPLRANRWGGSDSHGDEGNIVYGPSNYAGGRDWHELQQARAVNPSSATNGGSSGIVVSPTPDADGVREATRIPGRLDSVYDDEAAKENAEYWQRELSGPDGPRYAALGDAVTVPVIEWIGRRILAVHRE